MLDPNTVLLTVLAVATIINRVLDSRAKRLVATEVAQVKTTLTAQQALAQIHRDKLALTMAAKDVLLRRIQQTADDTHMLVNSNMGIQLKLHAETARELAEALPTPRRLKIAEEAEAALLAHLSRQAVVDRENAWRTDILVRSEAFPNVVRAPKAETVATEPGDKLAENIP